MNNLLNDKLTYEINKLKPKACPICQSTNHIGRIGPRFDLNDPNPQIDITSPFIVGCDNCDHDFGMLSLVLKDIK